MSVAATVLEAGVARTSVKGNDVAEFRPFGKVLRDLLIEAEITTGMGNPNWSAFAEKLPTVHYETLRKAITGEREPSLLVMREAAEALNRDPAELFVEYRLLEAQRQFDPREVGVEAALANLDAWTARRTKRR